MRLPTMDLIVVLVIVACTAILFATERFPADQIALVSLTALMLSGILTIREGLSGFASEATVTVAGLFVISAALARTGAITPLGRFLAKRLGARPRLTTVGLLAAMATLSAFVNNTAAMAVMLPLVLSASRESGISPSRLLMPLSFSSQAGGVCTLLGTSTNILAASIVVSLGLAPLGVFTFTGVGLVLAVAALLYLTFLAPWLIVERVPAQKQLTAKFGLGAYLSEIEIPPGSPLVGSTPLDVGASCGDDVELLAVVRAGRSYSTGMDWPLVGGDIILVKGAARDVLRFREALGLTAIDERPADDTLARGDLTLLEAVIPPGSSLIGHSLKDAHVRRRRGVTALAVLRHGESLRTRVADLKLRAGDALLVQGSRGHVEEMGSSGELLLLEATIERRERLVVAIGIAVGVVALAATGILPMVLAALAGAIAIVATGCLTAQEAYRAIDWKIILMLAGIIPVGIALDKSGGAALVASLLVKAAGAWGPIALLALLYLVTTLLTEVISNNACVVLMVPVAAEAATLAGVQPMPLIMAVAYAASTAFLTPVGYQTNAMVHGPGGYRFTDFLRVGGPLNVIFLLVATLVIPRFFPF